MSVATMTTMGATVPQLASHRADSWSWWLYDMHDRPVGPLRNVTGGGLEMNVRADTRHTGECTWVGPVGDQPDWLTHRVQPVYSARLMGGVTIQWAMGLYLPATPAVTVANGVATARVSLYDKTLILRQDRIAEDLAYDTGTNPIMAVWDQILAATGDDPANTPAIEETSERLRAPMYWEVGTTRLRIINDLLDAAGYFAVWADGDGRFRSAPYRAPRSRPVSWNFAPGQWSIHKDGWTRTADSFNVPNRVIAVATGTGEDEGLVAEAINIDPDDPYSFQRRGRWITGDPLRVEATSQRVLQGHADRALANARASTTFELEHALVPLGGNDRVTFSDPTLDPATVDAVVQTWRVDCTPGALVKSTVLEVV